MPLAVVMALVNAMFFMYAMILRHKQTLCLQPMKKGEIINVDGIDIVINQDTPAGHKVLLKDTAKGEDIIKYGYPIGHAIEDLKSAT